MRLTAALLLVVLALAAKDGVDSGVVVHEWGTFTSVAGVNGEAVPWAPLAGPDDLPCFVYEMSQTNLPKRSFSAKIRMETPVLYFYAQRPQTLSVKVEFPEGAITEWYPQASRRDVLNHDWTAAGPRFKDGLIEWDRVEVLPGARLGFPTSQGASHYFAARATDAAPLRVGDQQEKMLFYRGLASFDVPLRAKFAEDGRLEIRNTGAEAIPVAIVFENRNGHVGFRVARDVRDTLALAMPELTADIAALHRTLAAELIAMGLYEREALAMIETWRDSWFEPGMRVFYLMPPADVDRVLPLTVSPAPAQVARAFVGRVEVLSPGVRADLESAAAAGNVAALAKYGRFLEPFSHRMRLENRDLLQQVESEIARGFSLNSRTCVK